MLICKLRGLVTVISWFGVSGMPVRVHPILPQSLMINDFKLLFSSFILKFTAVNFVTMEALIFKKGEK